MITPAWQQASRTCRQLQLCYAWSTRPVIGSQLVFQMYHKGVHLGHKKLTGQEYLLIWELLLQSWRHALWNGRFQSSWPSEPTLARPASKISPTATSPPPTARSIHQRPATPTISHFNPVQ